MKINLRNGLIASAVFSFSCLFTGLRAQPVFADQVLSFTACTSGCTSGVENPGYAADADPQTYATLRNALGVGATVEVVLGFSTSGAAGSMLVIPVRKTNFLLDLGLLGSITIEALDASGNVLVQRVGLDVLDAGLLSSANQTYAATLFIPTGVANLARVRVRLTGLLSVTSLELGDVFYIQPSGSSCGIRYADTYSNGGTGICVGCAVSDPDRAVDADLTNYAQINMVLGIAATRYLELGWTGGRSAGDYVGLVVGNGGGLLSLSLLGNSTITLYNGSMPVYSMVASSVLGATLLSGGAQRNLIGFNAPADFTSIRISMTATVGLINTLRIYAALAYDPTPPVIGLSVSPSSVFCEGNTAQISATAGFSSYSWSSGQSTQQITVSQAGSYMATGKDAGGCPFFSSPLRLSLIPKPRLPQVTADPGNCLGGNIKFDLDSSRISYTYQVVHSVNGPEAGIRRGTGNALSIFSQPLYTSAGYRIKVTDTTTGCSALTSATLGVIAPIAPVQLSVDRDIARCWIKPGDRWVHFVRLGTGRIITSVNPKTNDLGQVEAFAYVDAQPIDIQACGTYQPWFITAAMNRRYVMQPQTQPTVPMGVRLYFDQADFQALALAANANANLNDDLLGISGLVLNKYSGLNENGSFTDNCGNGTVFMTGTTGFGPVSAQLTGFSSTGRYTDFTVPGFSEFWLNGNSHGNLSPLPISLQSFTLACSEGRVRADWTTASERNNAAFVLERSTNSIDWKTVTEVPGAGDSNEPVSYQASDENPLPGTTYYRLVQRDYDGSTETFAPEAVTCVQQPKTGWLIYPNPADATASVTLLLSSETAGRALLEMTDMTGKTVWTESREISQGTHEFILPGLSLPAGTYTVRLRLPGGTVKPVRLLLR